MILDQLIAFRERIPAEDAVPKGYKRQKVRWALNVSADGRVVGLSDLGTGKNATQHETPYAKRTSATKPLLLVDKPGYVLGQPEGDTDKHAAKASERHAAYLDLLDATADAAGDAQVARLAAALRDPAQLDRARDLLTAETWKPGDLILPVVGGETLHDRPAVRAVWQSRLAAAAAEKSGLTAECMACGRERPIARTHPIELLVGPDRVGMVTGNAAAFLSHGLEQSEIAPMCHDCARAYGEALRFLLRSPEHHLRVGDATWLFWTRDPATDFPFGRAIEDPAEADVRELLRAPHTGRQDRADGDAFYTLVVASNKSRLVVRSWLTLSVGQAKDNLRGYLDRQRVVGRGGDDAPLKLRALAGATARALKDVPEWVYTSLLEHALADRPLPTTILLSALRRAAVEEHPVTRPRAALIRLALASSHPDLVTSATLMPDHTHPAYHCGRLLSLLSDIQDEAIGANATLVDRFYGSASTSPASVFGTLMAKSVPHLSKLRRDSRKAWLGRFFQREVTAVMQHFSPEDGFPSTLSPTEQGLFAIGFYHQKHRPKKDATPDADTSPDTGAPADAALETDA